MTMTVGLGTCGKKQKHFLKHIQAIHIPTGAEIQGTDELYVFSVASLLSF